MISKAPAGISDFTMRETERVLLDITGGCQRGQMAVLRRFFIT